jgi:hypothetical protein
MQPMPSSLPRQPFSAWRIAGVPAALGVYLLWQGNEVIYIGRAMRSLRERLMEHYTRHARPWDATHFAWQPCARPAEREADLLREVLAALGRLPRYNA